MWVVTSKGLFQCKGSLANISIKDLPLWDGFPNPHNGSTKHTWKRTSRQAQFMWQRKTLPGQVNDFFVLRFALQWAPILAKQAPYNETALWWVVQLAALWIGLLVPLCLPRGGPWLKWGGPPSPGRGGGGWLYPPGPGGGGPPMPCCVCLRWGGM